MRSAGKVWVGTTFAIRAGRWAEERAVLQASLDFIIITILSSSSLQQISGGTMLESQGSGVVMNVPDRYHMRAINP